MPDSSDVRRVSYMQPGGNISAPLRRKTRMREIEREREREREKEREREREREREKGVTSPPILLQLFPTTWIQIRRDNADYKCSCLSKAHPQSSPQLLLRKKYGMRCWKKERENLLLNLFWQSGNNSSQGFTTIQERCWKPLIQASLNRFIFASSPTERIPHWATEI